MRNHLPKFALIKTSEKFHKFHRKKTLMNSLVKLYLTNLLKKNSITFVRVLTLLRMGLFDAAHVWRGQKGPLPKICHTYSTMMKLGTVIPYLKKIQKLFESGDTSLEICDLCVSDGGCVLPMNLF